MTPHTPLHGIHVPLITPFTARGDVAYDALEALAHSVLTAGATGIVALGTTAEAAALDPVEKRTITEVCARVCREHGAPLTVGAGTNDTRVSESALAELARRPEVTAALVTVPAFTRPSEEGVIAHFTRLAAAAPVPLIIYHVPYRTARPLSVSTLRTLARVPGIAGIKYAAGGISQETIELMGSACPTDSGSSDSGSTAFGATDSGSTDSGTTDFGTTDFAVLAGDDVFVSPMLGLGAAGGILASAHLATRRFADLALAWQEGDVAYARDLGHALARLSAALFHEPNPTVIKGVLHAQGLIPTADVRLPLLPAHDETVAMALRRLRDRTAPGGVRRGRGEPGDTHVGSRPRGRSGCAPCASPR
ncbi:dihydrodipicolinate synthase family protein [Streptomyces sp. NPDC053542]|uniref:dihydrodipicolinate synthase family protein n=1 Tax=Streptomyces sp. NPDC053542 TaxID=3365710 RepID=UPI0037D268F5